MEVIKKQCEYRSNGERCKRTTKGNDKYCWQHKEEMAEHSKELHPTDLINRITKRGKIIHLGCRGHKNVLELQLSQLPNVHCVAGDDPGEIDKDTSIVLLDVLPCWTLEQAQERIGEWIKAGAEIIAFLPLLLQQYQMFGQVRSWTKEELESLGLQVEVLPGFHLLPEGLVSAAWGNYTI